MKEILEYFVALDGYKIRQLEVIVNDTSPEAVSRYRDTYHELLKKSVCSEKEVADFVQMDPSGKAFRRFKHELKKRLYNLVLFINRKRPEYSPAQNAYFLCWQKMAIMKTAIGRDLTLSPSSIGLEIVELAQQYDLVDLGLEAARYLQYYYSMVAASPKEYHYFLEIANHQQRLLIAENQALEAYQALILPYTLGKSNKKQLNEVARKYLEILRPYAEYANTQLFIAAYYFVALFEHLNSFDWQSGYHMATLAIQRLQEKTGVSNRIVNLFRSNQIICLTMMERYSEALYFIEQSLEVAIPGGSDWLFGHKDKVLILMKMRKYQEAWEVMKKILEEPSLRFFSDAHQENVLIYVAHFSLLQVLGKIEAPGIDDYWGGKFKLQKFLNEVPIASKDKKGFNIPILVLQVFFLLKMQRYDEVEIRIESLRKYRSRHFNTSSELPRPSAFIRVLQVMLQVGFLKDPFQRKTSALAKWLLESKHQASEQYFEIEIISYEVLWEWSLELLD